MNRRLLLAFAPALLLACAAPAGDDGNEEAAADLVAPAGHAGGAPRTLVDRVGLSAGPTACASASCEASRQKFFGLVKDLGVKHLRFDLRWQDVEGKKGRYDFTATDRMIDAAAAAGVDVLGILAYGTTWSSSHDDQMYPPDHVEDFVDYAKTLVTHYDGKVTDYEVWNEPNAGFTFWKSSFGGDPKAFGSLTERTADAIHALPLKTPVSVAPGGTVYLSQFVPVFPFGKIPSGPDFMTDAIKANPRLMSSVDAYAFHAYTAYPPRNAPESAALGEVQLGDKIAKSKSVAGGRPLLLTEVGWPTANGVDENAQARWTIRTLLLAFLGDVDRTYLYTLYDGEKPPSWSFAPEGSFGLASADGKPKQAFHAVKALLTTMGDATSIHRLAPAGAPGDVYVVELERANGKKAWAAWRSDDRQGTWTWTLPANIEGRVLGLDGAAHGTTATTLGVTREPTYIVE